MNKIKKCLLLIAVLLPAMLSGCGSTENERQPDKPLGFSSFRDVPGVTAEEIKAIETVLAKRQSFSYAMLPCTEAFVDANGEIRGFAALVCEWLSEFFGIPFVLGHCTWDELHEGLRNGNIDFTHDLTPTPERRQIFHMTSSIAQRPIKYFRLSGSKPISEIAKERPLRYAILAETTTIDEVKRYAIESFELVLIDKYEDAYDLLKTGKIDAYIVENVAETAFDIYGDIVASDFLPLIYSPVSFTTYNPELAPFISVVQKALDNGAIHFLNDLYNQGNQEYLKHKFFMRLNDEEREYLKNHTVIPFMAEHDNYPVNFYNVREKQWQGMGLDVMREVEKLTGLEFKIVNEPHTEWYEILQMLENGVVPMVPELVRSIDREGRFLWPNNSFTNNQPILISKINHRNISINEVLSVKVGLGKGTAYSELFKRWFPEHKNIIEFDSHNAALDALMLNEVDMVMGSTHSLLYMTHFRELLDYKANIIFDGAGYESTFGFNVNETVLRSIIDKALDLIDTKKIREDWLRRSYDYRIKIAQARMPWIISAAGILLIALVFLIFFYIRNVKNLKIIANQAATVNSMNKRIEAMVNNLPGAVFQTIYEPPNYPYIFISKGCKEITGYTPEEMMGENAVRFSDLIHPEDVDNVMKIDSETLLKGLPFEAVYRFITKDGTIKWIWEHSHVIEKKPDGTPYLTEGHYLDITERRLLEIAEMANRAKTEFLATMSHEIRTPMNSIMGFAELAHDLAIVPQVKGYLCKITDSTRWLLRIINDILDISKIEAGKMELEHVPFDLQEVFSRCQSVILPNIKEKDLELSIYAEPSIGKKLLGDPVRLYQVLMNLLSNAVKFTNTGIVKFSSTIKDSDDTHTTVYFEVKDTGIGMSSDQIKKVFNPFIQADSSTTRDYGGTGLGLSIARNIVELMGGKLVVESSLGIGSTFSFEITFNTIEALDDTPSQNRFDIIEKPYFDGLVLICDDNSLNQQVICAHLARVGLQTMVAENGKIGVEMVRKRKENNEEPFDLILMDMFMPVMDGMEAATKIMAMNTGTPIVAMTANVMISELEKYKKHGMPDCLGKPFTSQELWQILLKYFTPISTEPISCNIDDDMEQQKMMLLNFYKNNQTVHTEIAEAVATNDIRLAHRLAHTLKGSAGLIGKTALRNAASDIETLLRDGTASIWDNKINILKTELMQVLEELKPLLEESSEQEKPQMLDVEQTLALFEKLGPMLEKVNPECADLLSSIRAVSGAEKLAQQIENYNFKDAAKTLAELKSKMGEGHE
ncbi:MAG: transporter substrate-binding domain-containing protein [Fibromonadaceae bacterium]|jgi:PAS domain S-box-containing protein|nr:transporter substrate-binding domain-containing protein [Fibromonadaceae bacterium]